MALQLIPCNLSSNHSTHRSHNGNAKSQPKRNTEAVDKNIAACVYCKRNERNRDPLIPAHGHGGKHDKQRPIHFADNNLAAKSGHKHFDPVAHPELAHTLPLLHTRENAAINFHIQRHSADNLYRDRLCNSRLVLSARRDPIHPKHLYPTASSKIKISIARKLHASSNGYFATGTQASFIVQPHPIPIRN